MKIFFKICDLKCIEKKNFFTIAKSKLKAQEYCNKNDWNCVVLCTQIFSDIDSLSCFVHEISVRGRPYAPTNDYQKFKK